jgi:UDP-glucuronate 4-epimerase
VVRKEQQQKMTEEGRKRILITGAAGFIGSHVAETLLRRGDYVIIVDDMNDYYDTRLKLYNLSILKSCYPSSCLAVYNGDIVDRQLMADIFEKEKPTHVCHLAARAGVRPSISDPYIYVRTNIEGTTCLLDLSRSYGIENFVYASSSSVYGGSDKTTLSEDDVVNKPVSPYAATKATCELLAYTFYHLYGMNSIGLRFFTVYGPRGRPDMAPFKFIDRIIRGIPIQQYGDGSTSRDYTYISDIVDGVIRALDRPMGCEVINLGNGNPFLLKRFIEIVEQAVGRKAVIEYLPEQPGDVERTCANVTKARLLLEYNPQVCLLSVYLSVG